jgi:hypothetical protein
MAGTIKVDSINADSNLALKIANTTVASVNSTGVLQFNSGFGSVATAYGCRAWCVFNGATTGTNAPIAGGNVSTVTRNSTGNYTINYTTLMPDANCAVVATSLAAITYLVSVPTTTSANVGTLNSAAAATDYAYVCVSVFR